MLNIKEFLAISENYYTLNNLFFELIHEKKNKGEINSIVTRIEQILSLETINVEAEIFANLTNQNIPIDIRLTYLVAEISPFIKLSINVASRIDDSIKPTIVSENYKELIIKYIEKIGNINRIVGRSLMVAKIETSEKINIETSTYFNNNQRFYLLQKLNLLDPLIKNNKFSQESKNNVIAHLLGIDTRTAKGLINGEEKYCVKEKGKLKVDEFLLGLK